MKISLVTKVIYNNNNNNNNIVDLSPQHALAPRLYWPS
jgi:hypothetical protein